MNTAQNLDKDTTPNVSEMPKYKHYANIKRIYKATDATTRYLTDPFGNVINLSKHKFTVYEVKVHSFFLYKNLVYKNVEAE